MALGLRNSAQSYGLVALFLHWTVALLLIGLFFLGLYMTGLDYMDPWYRAAPDLHKSFGLTAFFLMIFRYLWRLFDTTPEFVPMPRFEAFAALSAHRLFYLLTFAIAISGFLITTADGRGVEFFSLFELPSLVSGMEGQEDVSGSIHYILAFSLMGLAALHALAALRHHFLDKDATLLKMLGVGHK